MKTFGVGGSAASKALDILEVVGNPERYKQALEELSSREDRVNATAARASADLEKAHALHGDCERMMEELKRASDLHNAAVMEFKTQRATFKAAYDRFEAEKTGFAQLVESQNMALLAREDAINIREGAAANLERDLDLRETAVAEREQAMDAREERLRVALGR